MIKESQLDKKLKQAKIDQIKHSMRDKDRSYQLKARTLHIAVAGTVAAAVAYILEHFEALKTLLSKLGL
ncbi:MAG: hypothetical protein RPR97_13780 [Colwellia sp.]